MFMAWPSAVPLDTMLNLMDSALSASATMVLVVLFRIVTLDFSLESAA
jgi:hypothetical protein